MQPVESCSAVLKCRDRERAFSIPTFFSVESDHTACAELQCGEGSSEGCARFDGLACEAARYVFADGAGSKCCIGQTENPAPAAGVEAGVIDQLPADFKLTVTHS